MANDSTGFWDEQTGLIKIPDYYSIEYKDSHAFRLTELAMDSEAEFLYSLIFPWKPVDSDDIESYHMEYCGFENESKLGTPLVDFYFQIRGSAIEDDDILLPSTVFAIIFEEDFHHRMNGVQRFLSLKEKMSQERFANVECVILSLSRNPREKIDHEISSELLRYLGKKILLRIVANDKPDIYQEAISPLAAALLPLVSTPDGSHFSAFVHAIEKFDQESKDPERDIITAYRSMRESEENVEYFSHSAPLIHGEDFARDAEVFLKIWPGTLIQEPVKSKILKGLIRISE